MKKYIDIHCIKSKLTASILVFMLVPIIFITYHINSQFQKNLKEDFIKSTTKEIVGVDNTINVYLDALKQEVEFLVNDKVVINADKTISNYVNSNKKIEMTPSKNGGIEEEIYNLYLQFGKAHPKLEYVYMGSVNGGFVQWPEGQINRNYDPRIRPWYKAALQDKGKVIITSPYYYPSGNAYIISAVKTIQDSNKNLVGVQGIDISLKGLTDMVKNIRIGENGYIILVDSNGTIMAHPKNKQMNFKNIKELKVEKLNNIQNIKSANYEIYLDGKKQLINIYTSPKTNWKFISVVEEEELFKNLNKVKEDILHIAERFALMAIIISIMFSNKFSKPIVVIEKHLKYISSGDFSKKIPISILKRKDEIGNLSLAIEAMQNRLENLIGEIKSSEKAVKENANFLQTLIDTIPNPIFSKDEKGLYNYCNNYFTEYLGIKKEKIIGHDVYEIIPKELADVYYEADKQLMETKGLQNYEAKVVKPDGQTHHVVFNKAAIVNVDGEVKGLVGVIMDITEEKKNNEKIEKLLKLKESMIQIGYSINEMVSINEMLQVILDKVIECIDEKGRGSVLILDKDNRFRIAVARGYDIEKTKDFSIKLEESFAWIVTKGNVDKTVMINNLDEISDINPLETNEGIRIKSVISAPITVYGKLYGFLNLDGTNINAFNERDFELMEYMRNQVSIAIMKHKLYEETIYLSRYDKLTSIYNRSYFEELLYTDIYKAVREKIEFFVVVFDLNGLKFVNDNYGHLAGDELIRTFARGLRSLAKDGDIVARFGGDEFIGVFFNTELQNLTNSCEGLIEDFKANPINFEGKTIICSYSYGISNFPKEGDDSNQLIKIADERMYQYKSIYKSKNNSINRV